MRLWFALVWVTAAVALWSGIERIPSPAVTAERGAVYQWRYNSETTIDVPPWFIVGLTIGFAALTLSFLSEWRYQQHLATKDTPPLARSAAKAPESLPTPESKSAAVAPATRTPSASVTSVSTSAESESASTLRARNVSTSALPAPASTSARASVSGPSAAAAAGDATRPRQGGTVGGTSAAGGLGVEIRSSEIKRAKGGEWELDSVLATKTGLDSFMAHLQAEFSPENLQFWSAVKAFRSSYPNKSETERLEMAKAVYDTYIDPVRATSQVNLPAIVVTAIAKQLAPPPAPGTAAATASAAAPKSQTLPPTAEDAKSAPAATAAPATAASVVSDSPPPPPLPTSAKSVIAPVPLGATRSRGSAIHLLNPAAVRASIISIPPPNIGAGGQPLTPTTPTTPLTPAAGSGAAAAAAAVGTPRRSVVGTLPGSEPYVGVTPQLFDVAATNVFALMADDSFRRYLSSPRYQTFLSTVRIGP